MLRKLESNGQETITGLLTVTFKGNLFGISAAAGDAQPVRVRIKDVTNPARSPVVGTEFPPQAANVGTIDDEAKDFYATEHRIGGHKFHFDCRRNPNYDFRPAWLPWTAAISGLALTALCACGWTVRDNRRLERRVTKLDREVGERKEMQRFLQTLLEFREQERELVAHEIHDGFVQEVVGAQMFVQAIAARLSKDDHSSQRDLAMAGQLLSKAIEEGRRMISDLKPSLVDEMGLLEAVKQLVNDEEEHFGLSITFRHSANLRRLPPLVERTLYRIIQESVNNVKRHSGLRGHRFPDSNRPFGHPGSQRPGTWIRYYADRRRAVRRARHSGASPIAARTCHDFNRTAARHRRHSGYPLEGLGISATPHSQRQLSAHPSALSDQSSRAASSS